MRRYNTQAEMDNIPNVSFKRNAICQNYMSYGTTTDIQTYLEEQLDANPKLLAWLFDDASLIGKSYLSFLKPSIFEFMRTTYSLPPRENQHG